MRCGLFLIWLVAGCAPPARNVRAPSPSTAQRDLVDLARSVDADLQIDSVERARVLRALLDWAASDRRWVDMHDAEISLLRAVRFDPQAAWPSRGRAAALHLAEAIRRDTRSAVLLLVSCRIAASYGPRRPEDAYAPEPADEARLLRLDFAALQSEAARTAVVDARLRLQLHQGTLEAIVGELPALEGPDWQRRVEERLTSDDPGDVRFWLSARAIVSLRACRAAYLGQVQQPVRSIGGAR